jgi:hypothetical protein
MNKYFFNYLILAAVIAANSLFFVSCNDDENEPPTIKVGMVVNMSLGTYTPATPVPNNTNVDGKEGDILTFFIQMKKGSDKIIAVKVEEEINETWVSFIPEDLEQLDAGLFDGGEDEIEFRHITGIGNSNKRIRLTVTDRKRSNIFIANIRPQAQAKEDIVDGNDKFVYNTAVITVAAHHNSIGSSYGYSAGVLRLAAAKAGAAYIDFLYVNTMVMNGLPRTFGAPANDAVAGTFVPTNANRPATWNPRNDTKMQLVKDADKEKPSEWWVSQASDLHENHVSGLAVNDAVLFARPGQPVRAAIITEVINNTISFRIMVKD